MNHMRRFAVMGVLAASIMVALGSTPSLAQPRAHVYLLRGLMNIFSLGMDTLAAKLQNHGVYATVHNHSEWQSLADQAAAAYRAGTEGPIILIGHSLGADAVMQMAAYLGTKGVPVALVIPFDGTASYAAAGNVGRVVNLTQRDYAHMRRGPNFHGTLVNVDVSSDGSIDHITIDKSARLHARAIAEVLAVVGGGGHRASAPGPGTAPHEHNAGTAASPASGSDGASKPVESAPASVKPANGAATTAEGVKPVADGGTSVIARPEKSSAVTAGPE